LRKSIERFSDQIKKALTRRALDIAEVLPKFQGGFLQRLQSMRQRQRKAAADLHTATRASSGIDVTYVGFRLFELFPAEEHDKLSTGLRRLFPTRQYGFDEIDRFTSTAGEMFNGGWSNIGVLVRDRSLIWSLQNRLLPELPEEIQSVEVSVHKILPSAIVAVFDVTLTQTATKTLKTLHEQHYLPEVWFHKWFPWRKHSWARSESRAERAMKDAILEWESSLHFAVEQIVTSYLSGFFRRAVNRRLPLIDIFAVSGVVATEDTETALPKSVASWMESLVLLPRAWSLETCVGDNLIFAWKEDADERPCVPYRLVETYAQLPQEKGDQYFTRRGRLDALLPYLCFIEAISSVQVQLEALRILVYRTLTRTGFFRRRLRREIRLNDRIQKEAMFIGRLTLELEDAKPWIKHETRILQNVFRQYVEPGQAKFSLPDMLEGMLNFRFDRVKKHLAFVAKMFTEYVSRRNLAVMYRLQRQVLFLAIIATFLPSSR
jgi:hypothetical protein